MNLMDLVVKITASDDASSKVEKISSGIKKGLAGAAKAGAAAVATGTAAVTAGLVAMSKASVDSYADYEQLTGGIETLFGETADVMIRRANNAFATTGLSANEYMETVTGFSAALLQGLGGDTAAAADAADGAINDMIDNASKMGTSMESIQFAYQGFAKQNYTMLDNLKLGYGGTGAEMARLINDSGVLADVMEVTSDNINEVSFDKIIEAIHQIQVNMGMAGNAALEATSTIEGSANATKAAWANLLTRMADDSGDFAEQIDDFIGMALNTVELIIPRVVTIFDNLANNLSETMPYWIEYIVSDILPKIQEAAQQIMESISVILSEMMPLIAETIGVLLPILIETILTIIPSIVESMNTILEAIIAALPSIIDGIVTVLVESLPLIVEAGVTLLTGLIEAVGLIIEKLVPQIPTIVTTIITTLLEHLPDIIQGALQLFIGIIDALPLFLVMLVANLPKIISSIVTTLLDSIPMLIECGLQLFMSLIAAFPEFIAGLIVALPEIASTIIDELGKIDLLEIGKKVLQSFLNGLISIKDKIVNFFSGLTSLIPKIKGPEDVDKKLLTKNGSLIMGGLLGGLEKGWDEVEDFLTDKTADIGGAFDVSGTIDSSVSPSGIAGGVTIVIENFTHSGSESDDDELLNRIGRKVNMRMRGVGIA